MALTQVSPGLLNAEAQAQGFRNRIINGDMRIDQRNAGAAVTASGYVTDRWAFFENGSMVFSVQQSTTAPSGFVNSLAVTVSTAASPASATRSQLYQSIEGLNVSDLGWGTASAKTITLSFWVRSSLTGQFGGSIQNSSKARSYPFSYSISAANTWEYKTITIPGDTSGTWLTTNGIGVDLMLDLGAGSDLLGTAGSWAGADYRGATGDVKLAETSGATFYITGVQLEVGSVATEFERRPYGTELALCQRYYWKTGPGDSSVALGGTGAFANGTTMQACFQFPVNMRSNPTASQSGGSIADGTAASAITSISTSYYSPMAAQLTLVASGGSFTAKSGGYVIAGSTSAYVAFSAEL